LEHLPLDPTSKGIKGLRVCKKNLTRREFPAQPRSGNDFFNHAGIKTLTPAV
jgi:hypothetical protein